MKRPRRERFFATDVVPRRSRSASDSGLSQKPLSNASRDRGLQQRSRRGREQGLPKATQPPGRIVCGTHAASEVLRVRPESINEVWLDDAQPTQRWAEVFEQARHFQFAVNRYPDARLSGVAKRHQGIVVFARDLPPWDWEALRTQDAVLVLVLDGIEDPQNLGAILRSAWLMGVYGVLLPRDRSAGITQSATRVACGAIEHVRVETCTSLPESMDRLKEMGFWVYGLAEKGRVSSWQLEYPLKVAWVVGAEDKGLRTATQRRCDELVRLEQVESGSSYNASVAAALAMYETVRYWRSAAKLAK